MRRLIAMADAVSVTAALALGAALLARIALSAADVGWLPFLVGLVLGYLAADVASGLAHWFCDTYFAPETPLIGPMLIAPFREHHVDPSAIARHGFLERNGNNCLAALPVLVLALVSLAPGAPRHGWQDVASGCLASLAFTLCLTNQIHAWVHAATAPRIVRRLQRAGLLLTPARHAVHHRGERSYAVVSGWSNAWLDRALAGAERVLAAFGAQACGDAAGRATALSPRAASPTPPSDRRSPGGTSSSPDSRSLRSRRRAPP